MYRNYRRENREKNSCKRDIAILANSHAENNFTQRTSIIT